MAVCGRLSLVVLMHGLLVHSAQFGESECPGHSSISKYEEIRSQCRALYTERPRCNLTRAILSSPVYAIDAKNDLNKYLHGHGFKNVHKVTMIPRTRLNGFCEYSNVEANDKEPSARLFHLNTEVKAARAALGMAYTHRNIYVDIVNSNEPCSFVFERNFHLAPHWQERLELGGVDEFLLEHDFSVLKLGYCNSHRDNPIIPNEEWEGREPVDVLPGLGGPCAHAYLISSWGACLHVATNTPVWKAADSNFEHKHYRWNIDIIEEDAPSLAETLSRQNTHAFAYHIVDEIACKSKSISTKRKKVTEQPMTFFVFVKVSAFILFILALIFGAIVLAIALVGCILHRGYNRKKE